MTPEQQLVQQIREVMANDQLEQNPVLEDFAEQFAELCHDINARLQRCTEYLDKGMRSEAVHEARSVPELLPLVKTVGFEEQARWRNICIDLKLMPPPPIGMEMVERLRTECMTEQDLEPLLKEYRRHVYQGDRDACIRLLRELRERDADNQSWPENLEPLEQEQLPELLDKVGQAVAAENLDALKTLHAELTHSQRVVPAPEALMEQIRDVLLSERREETLFEGQNIARRLVSALKADKEEVIGELLAQWEKLVGDEAFEPTPDLESVAAEGMDWRKKRETERAAETEFQGEIDTMWALLENSKASEAEILHGWDVLGARGRALPEALESSVEESLERRRRARKRKWSLVIACVVVALAVLTVAGVLSTLAANERKRREAVLAKAESLFESRSFDELQDYLEGVRTRDISLYNSPEMRHFQNEAHKAVEMRESREKSYAALMGQLNDIRRAEYAAGPEQVRAVLAEVRQFADTDKQTRAVAEWQHGWEQWGDREQRRTDGELQRVTSAVKSLLAARARRPFASFAVENSSITRAEAALAEGSPYVEGATTSVVDAYNAVTAAVTVWKRDYAQRAEQDQNNRQKLTDLRDQIPTVLPDQEQYTALLREFTTLFPDLPETPHFRRALGMSSIWTAASKLKSFSMHTFPPEQAKALSLRKLFSDGKSPEGSVWEPDLAACIQYLDAVNQARVKLPTLLLNKTDTLNLKVLRYRRKGEKEWKRLYHSKPITNRVETDDQGTEFKVYWGMVYYYDTPTDKPWLTHTSKVFPDKLNTKDFDIQFAPRAQDNLVGHGRILYRFIAEANEAAELDVHLLQGIRQTLLDKTLDPVPRAWVLKRLVHFLAESFPEVPGVDAMLEQADSMNTNAPWMNPNHPEVLAANKDIEQKMAAFPEVEKTVRNLQLRRAILALALSRQVRCVGSLQLSKDGELEPILVRPLEGEAWIVQKDAAGTRPFFKVVGEVAKDGSLRLSAKTRGDLYAGQILFAPSDGRSCTEALKDCRTDAGKNSVLRPASWPVNGW